MIPSLTPEYLQNRLRTSGALPDGSVTAILPGDMGDDLIRFDALFSPDTPPTVPLSYIIKTNTDGFPKASCEFAFYANIAPRIVKLVSSPTYDAHLDEESGNSFILQADLSNTHSFAVTSDREPTVEGLGAVVDQIASIHATCWDQPFIQDDTYTTKRNDICDMAQAGDPADLWATTERTATEHLERMFKIAPDLPADLLPACRAAIEAWPSIIENRYCAPNLTLIHADLHPWNIFVPNEGSGPPLIFDWELLSRGIGVYDVSYLIIRCRLNPEERHSFGEALIPRYHTQLCECGVDGYSL